MKKAPVSCVTTPLPFLRELVNEGVIELLHCHSEEQIADVMTKPMKAEAFTKFKKLMGMCKLDNIS